MKNRKGFTLIELIVVIAILGILALFLVPSFLGYTKDAQKATCVANRNIIERSYSFYKIRNEDVKLSEYILNDGSEYKDTQCPSGGIYTYDDENGKVLCSIHGTADDETSDPDRPSDEPEETKATIPGTDLEIDPNVITIKNGDSINNRLGKGTIIKIDDNGDIGYYIVKDPIGNNNPINVSNNDLIKITDEKAITVNGTGQDAIKKALGPTIKIGDKILYDGNYYICTLNDSNYGPIPGNSYVWLEIK